MKKKINKLSLICLIICSVLCVALIVTQFMPSWSAEVEVETADGAKVTQQKDFSVWDYLSFPEHDTQKQLGKIFEKEFGKDVYKINDLAGTACLILGFGVLTVIFTALGYDKTWTFVFPLVAGVGGLLGYLTQPVLQISYLWLPATILCAVLSVAALLAGVGFFISIKKWFAEDE